jgi:hypothetical protein
MLNWTSPRDECGPDRDPPIAAPRGSWIDNVDPAGDNVQLARPCPASIRGQRHGEAEELGQGVQPQPRNRSRPSAFDFGRGEPTGVAQRQRSRRPQAPSAGWGAKPRPPSEARLPLAGLRAAQVGPAGTEGSASSRAAQPKTNGRNDRAAQPLPGVAALRAAGPRGRRSRPLEAEGREGAVKRADAAYSRVSAGAAALAAGAKRRPARCTMHCASTRTYKQPFEIKSDTSSIASGRRRFEDAFAGDGS